MEPEFSGESSGGDAEPVIEWFLWLFLDSGMEKWQLQAHTPLKETLTMSSLAAPCLGEDRFAPQLAESAHLVYSSTLHAVVYCWNLKWDSPVTLCSVPVCKYAPISCPVSRMSFLFYRHSRHQARNRGQGMNLSVLS
jgi:hypothetical protein